MNRKTMTTMAVIGLVGLVGLSGLTGCGQGEGNDTTASHNGGEAFDLSDIGMRGMEWQGTATLLSAGLDFPEAELNMDTIGFSLIASGLDLSGYVDPPLEFRGEPVSMSLSIGGLIEDHEPGSVTVAISRVSPGFTGGLGSKSEREMIGKLEQHGITYPEASSDDPIMVTFDVAAGDEDYTEITLTSDAEFIGRIDMQEGEQASL